MISANRLMCFAEDLKKLAVKTAVPINRDGS